MFESAKHVSVTSTLLTASLISLLLGCGYEQSPPRDCLQKEGIPEQIVADTPPSSFHLVEVCEEETGLRGYLSTVLFVPTDSTLGADRFTLFLGGHSVPDLRASTLGVTEPAMFLAIGDSVETRVGTYRIVEFPLERREGNRAVWARILNLASDQERPEGFLVGVSSTGDMPLPALNDIEQRVKFRTRPVGGGEFGLGWGLLLIWVFGSLYLLNSLRAGTGDTLPFSLSKVLMFFWSALIGIGYCWVWLKTGDFNGVLNNQALILMGIQGATLAGAAGLNNTNQYRRRSTGNYPVSRFFLDILQGSDGKVSIHRGQNLMWNLSLGAIFAVFVFSNLWFPEFDQTLLIVSGIGNGIYLSGKVVGE